MGSRLILFLGCGKRHAKCLVASFVERPYRWVTCTRNWLMPVGTLRMDIVLMVGMMWQHEKPLGSAILEAVCRFGLPWLPREKLHEGLHFRSYR